MNYSESDAFQREIAQQYEQRKMEFSTSEVSNTLTQLGFTVDEDGLQIAEVGNMNATFISDNYVVKISKESEEREFYPNVLVSETLTNEPVVRVLAYDFFDTTSSEVLVMERANGEVWQKSLPDMSQKEVVGVFEQVLDVVNKAANIESDTFGDVTNPETRYETYPQLLRERLSRYTDEIRTKNLVEEKDIAHIESYVRQHVDVFANDTAVLTNEDLHMGNVLHEGDRVTAVIDWDTAEYAPKCVGLIPLLGVIDNPAQFVEGTSDHPRYKGKSFEYLLPVLQEKMPDVCNDPQLVQKLNMLGILAILDWVAQDLSQEWNKEQIAKLVKEETPQNAEKLPHSYYGRMLTKIK